jgi:hypothetical protein
MPGVVATGPFGIRLVILASLRLSPFALNSSSVPLGDLLLARDIRVNSDFGNTPVRRLQ